MHTDEYEISIGREVSMCRRRIGKLGKAIRKMEERYAMTTEALLDAYEQGRLDGPNPDHLKWIKDHRELLLWTKMLKDYEDALRGLKDV